jgi:hypothetical protein
MLELKLLPDWHRRLDELVRARLDAPFAWGTNDCAMFAADCVMALTGEDFLAEFRGTYRTALAAARILEAHGGLRGLVEAKFGPPLLSQWEAVPGDIGLVQIQTGACLALCAGPQWLGPGETGLTSMKREHAIAAWKVGR